MTKANTQVIAKVAALVAGAGLVLSFFAIALPASAQTTTTTTTTTSSATFSRDLTIGSTGADVTALQTWLIGKGFSIPAGATGYFGSQTQAAVAAYQAANGITPAAGYFGPITRAHVNAGGSVSTGGSSTVPGCAPGAAFSSTTGAPCTGGSTGGSTNTGGLSGGEASLEDLDIRNGDDDEVEEGGSAEIAEISFDVEDGDVRIDRVDLKFVRTGGDADEDDPWEAFDTITLYDEDGDELASEDVSDEDDWLDEDNGIFRFTGLDYVVREGDTAMIMVEVEAQRGVLDNNSNGDTWTLTVEADAIRGVDSEGIQQYLDDTDNVDFDLVVEGDGEELSVSSSDEDPDASVLKVEDDGRSDWHTIFAFDLEAEDNDIEIDDINIRLETVGSTVGEQINDLELLIDGDTFDDYSYVGADGTDRVASFDIDGDLTVDDGDTVTVELRARFNSTAGALDDGDTIRASVQDNNPFVSATRGVNGEGSDDVNSDGAATGERHTLSLSSVEVSDVDWSTSRNEAGDSGTISFEFTVEATDGNVTIDGEDPEDGATGSIRFTVLGPDGSIADANLVKIGGDNTTGTPPDYVIAEGDEATFSLDVTLTTVDSNDNGSYRVRLDSVAGVKIDQTSGSIFLTDL